MRRFEYLLLNTGSGFFTGFNYKQLNEHLNRLGSQGWEVVTVASVEAGAGQTTGLLFTLKRELPLG